MPHLLPLDSYLFQFLIPQELNSSLLAFPQARWAPLPFLPDVLALLLFMINPFLISMSFSWVIIDFIYFYTPTVTRIYPPNSFVNGSAIDSILLIFSVLIAAFRAIVQRRKFQALIPAMPEECTSPMRTFLLSCMLFQLSSMCFLFKPPLFLLISLFLIVLFLLLALPLVKKDTRGHPGLRSRGFSNLNLASQDARRFSVDLLHCYLSSRIN
jgi:hypothetical protein